jgi:hypothetical protein
MPQRKTIPRTSVITITLPDLSANEASLVLDIIEDLHSKLWHVHGEAIVELVRLRNEAASADDVDPEQDDLPF